MNGYCNNDTGTWNVKSPDVGCCVKQEFIGAAIRQSEQQVLVCFRFVMLKVLAPS
jgi:hypothetical protein